MKELLKKLHASDYDSAISLSLGDALTLGLPESSLFYSVDDYRVYCPIYRNVNNVSCHLIAYVDNQGNITNALEERKIVILPANVRGRLYRSTIAFVIKLAHQDHIDSAE